MIIYLIVQYERPEAVVAVLPGNMEVLSTCVVMSELYCHQVEVWDLCHL